MKKAIATLIVFMLTGSFTSFAQQTVSGKQITNPARSDSFLLKPVNHRKSITWLSFPRLPDTITEQSIQQVLGQNNIVPGKYYSTSRLLSLDAATSEFTFALFEGDYWNPNMGLMYLNRKAGYKLTLYYGKQYDSLYIRHSGVIKADATVSRLYAFRENWIAYWPEKSQHPFDALANILPALYLLKAQDWCCVRYDHLVGPGGPWICDDELPLLSYGQMLIIKPYQNISDFQWNQAVNLETSPAQTTALRHFTFEEQDNYIPLVIDLDDDDEPSEIAVFSGKKCIGSSLVKQGGTTVIVKAYRSWSTPDSIRFVKFYGNANRDSVIVSNYEVWDFENKRHEKKKLRLGLYPDRQFVSFNRRKVLMTKSDLQLGKDRNGIFLLYSLDLDVNDMAEFYLYNGSGQLLWSEIIMDVPSGVSRGKLQLLTGDSNKLKPGIYLVKLKSGQIVNEKKVIVK